MRASRLGPTRLAWSALALALAAAPSPAQTPLHQRVDELIAARLPEFKVAVAPLASDEEFLRRASLDLAGTIPSAEEARAFLADTAADKRAKLVDRLLASPFHVAHLRNVLDRLLMERRPDRLVTRAEWREYLRAAVADNKPWDQLVREILAADGADPKLRPAAKFYLDRGGEPNLITKDISRIFLGTNLQCAQCHDHPLVEAYKQDHYQGIFAFLNRSYLFPERARNAKQPVVFAEKAEGEVSFQSVFDKAKKTKTTGPRLPGRPPVAEPKLEKGKEYAVAPAANVQPVPRYSRRAQLAGQITDGDNAAFRRNIANRLWALLMGRGLVHPLELDHPDNPPSHPELLTVLADDIMARKYDMRGFLRELALSQTYQRSSEPAAGVQDVLPETFATANLKPLSPEQLAWSLMQATGLADVERAAQGKKRDEAALLAKLAGNETPFVTAFGGQPGEDETQQFQATLDQTLFLANGDLVRGWLAPRPGNLADRLLKLADPKALAEELYLSVLTRRPSAEEQAAVASYLKGRPQDRPAAVQELAWALLASAEFRFNH